MELFLYTSTAQFGDLGCSDCKPGDIGDGGRDKTKELAAILVFRFLVLSQIDLLLITFQSPQVAVSCLLSRSLVIISRKDRLEWAS